MSADLNTVIGNASEIIDLFGGIRPMSSKTGIPVTTIQGWKQRNAIPASRKNELIEAANRHGIMLGELLMDIAGDKDVMAAADDEKLIQKEKMVAARLDPDLKPAGNQAVLLAAGALILAAAVGGTFVAVAPKFKQVTAQDIRIRELEQQIAQMQSAQQEVEQKQVSAETTEKIAALEGRLGQLTEQAKSYGAVFEDLKSGTMEQRLNKIENHVGTLLKQTNVAGLQNLVQKFEGLQNSSGGMTQIQGIMSSLIGAGAATTAMPDADIGATFAALKTTDPQVAETFKDVAPEDMKAAVMLLGMTQLRSSLARDNQSFEQDLQILKMTMAKDNPELQAAIDKLAPRAKSGVLTPTGLSKELRGLTGDIVSASLTGQDISVKDKAIARLDSIVKVEKNGQQISGTSTQITIAEAQKKLDAGDVEGAVALLEQINGPAAEKTKPVIDAARATMLASQVQQLIGRDIVQTLKGIGTKSNGYTNTGAGVGVEQILNQVKTIGTTAAGGL